MIEKTNPEFGVELALTVPYAYWLHQNNQLEKVITSKGMTPFYFFADEVIEEFQYRTIDNAAAGLGTLPNDWIHGINSQEEPGVLDYSEWEVPPFANFYKNDFYKYKRPTIFINNKYNLEHGEVPYGFFDIKCLNDLFITLDNKGYDVIYKRATNREKDFTFDQNEMNSLNAGYHDIKANVEGVGIINDFQLTEYFNNVTLLDKLVEESDYDYNFTQLRIMANCSGFITVCGGNSILCSLFGKPVISYVHKGKELRPNYFGPNTYFQKLSNNNVHPAIDVIGAINSNTYHHPVNETGTNDYSKVFELTDKIF